MVDRIHKVDVQGAQEFGDGDSELCTCCLKPVMMGVNFCGQCGAPLGFLAATLPYQRILAEGFVYRRAIEAPRSLISLVGIWILFGQTFITAAALMIWGWGNPEVGTDGGNLFDLGLIIVSAGMAVIAAAGIVRATRNYLRRPGARAPEEAWN